MGRDRGARQSRPNRPVAECPFCVGGLEAPEQYEAKAFVNRWPMWVPGDAVERTGSQIPARGASEVVLYSPDHDASLASLGVASVRRVIDLWAARTVELLARPEVKYVLIFENRGRDAGATIAHPHGQIYGFPFVPPVPTREAEVARRDGCPLCREEPGERLVYESGGWRAWVPYASAYPYGLLLAPTAHVGGLPELDDVGRNGLAAALIDCLSRLDRLFDRAIPVHVLAAPRGASARAHCTTPTRCGDTALHRRRRGGSGTLTNPIAPEFAAERLRNA